jgi:DNA-binding LacI/PurR family transcriptional regulator
MAITLQKVAKLAGTSPATVSDVLRDRWRQKGISEPTRNRVLAVVKQLNYQPNQVARSLARRRTQIIGIQLSSFQYDYFLTLIQSFHFFARQYGYQVLLGAPAVWQDETDELIRLYGHQVDGLILRGQDPVRLGRGLEPFRSDKIPIVFLCNAYQEEDCLVIDDNEAQAGMAVDHLVGLGHTRIAHLRGPYHHGDGDGRCEGYLASLRAHGLAAPPEYLELIPDWNVDQAGTATKKFLALPSPPTAVYCANDGLALGAIRAVEEFGLKVPEDISVVGHGDDIPFSWFSRIPLTTVRQAAQDTAKKSTQMVIDLIEGREIKERRVMLPGELVVRKSSGPVKEGGWSIRNGDC